MKSPTETPTQAEEKERQTSDEAMKEFWVAFRAEDVTAMKTIYREGQLPQVNLPTMITKTNCDGLLGTTQCLAKLGVDPNDLSVDDLFERLLA